MRLAMPFNESLPTLGNVIPGGAISTLIDTAAAAPAWPGADVPERPRASTVGISVNFLAPASGKGLTAEGQSHTARPELCFCEVLVADEDGNAVANGLVSYRL